jgi:CHAD domain-containing protein
VDVALSPWVDAIRSLLGLDVPTDPQAIHRARTATRRLRSNLRSLDDVIDPPAGIREDLAWVGDSLGAVRDTDVLGDRLAGMLVDAPGLVQQGGTMLLSGVANERRDAHERLRRDIAGGRFGNLVHDLDVLVKEASSAGGTIDAATVLRPRWRALRVAVRSLDSPASDTQLHEVRIQTKRARYAAEIFQEVGGAACRRFLRRATALQDILGEQHDAARACEWLLGQEIDDAAAARSAGWLAAGAAEDRASLREAWRPSWRSLGRRKARFW